MKRRPEARHGRRPAHSTSDRPAGGWLRRPRGGWLRWYLRQPRRQLFDPLRDRYSPAYWTPFFGLLFVVGGVGGVIAGSVPDRLQAAVALLVGLAALAGWLTYLSRPATIPPERGVIARGRRAWQGWQHGRSSPGSHRGR